MSLPRSCPLPDPFRKEVGNGWDRIYNHYFTAAMCAGVYLIAAKECFDEWHVEPGGSGVSPSKIGKRLIVDKPTVDARL